MSLLRRLRQVERTSRTKDRRHILLSPAYAPASARRRELDRWRDEAAQERRAAIGEEERRWGTPSRFSPVQENEGDEKCCRICLLLAAPHAFGPECHGP
jgi:hypothetical protein